nr:MAG TPA_asm: hypothetical protein [Caudoviricetes sp.]
MVCARARPPRPRLSQRREKWGVGGMSFNMRPAGWKAETKLWHGL